MAIDGLTTLKSDFSPGETVARLEAAVQTRGLSVFARLDHAAGAAAVGLPLPPTVLVIFGNARGGTPLMQARRTAGIDLPLKALVWQDDSGVTCLSYNEPAWLAARHGLPPQTNSSVRALTATLSALAEAATQRSAPREG
jgi:uncharacterized protein (DUF302 family)